ncbi:MAG: putative colanic acid biosynthesis acetyltransferase [Gammaproteobacteria bacterium]
MHDAPLQSLDARTNRAARKYSAGEQMRRVLWIFGRWLMRLSPRPCFAWRRMVLRLFGARVGAHVNVYPSTNFYMPWNVELDDWSAVGEDVLIYSLGKVRIGRNATVSYRSHVCAGTHDLNDPTLPLLKPPVVIEDAAWIGTDAFIGPGVTIGRGAVVGARAVVVKNVEPLDIVAGNPARVVSRRNLHIHKTVAPRD